MTCAFCLPTSTSVSGEYMFQGAFNWLRCAQRGEAVAVRTMVRTMSRCGTCAAPLPEPGGRCARIISEEPLDCWIWTFILAPEPVPAGSAIKMTHAALWITLRCAGPKENKARMVCHPG